MTLLMILWFFSNKLWQPRSAMLTFTNQPPELLQFKISLQLSLPPAICFIVVPIVLDDSLGATVFSQLAAPSIQLGHGVSLPEYISMEFVWDVVATGVSWLGELLNIDKVLVHACYFNIEIIQNPEVKLGGNNLIKITMIGQQDMCLTPENNQKDQILCQDHTTVKKVLRFQKSKDLTPPEKQKLRHSHIKREVVCQTFEIPILSICLLLLISLAAFILHSDYQRKVSSLQQQLIDTKEECKLNYTSNMCDDRSLRAQRDFCYRQKLCMERNTTEQLERRVKGAGIVGEIVRDFVDSLGYYGLVVVILLTYSAFNKHGNGHRFFRRIVEKQYYHCDI